MGHGAACNHANDTGKGRQSARLVERGFLSVAGEKRRYREFYPAISREEYLRLSEDELKAPSIKQAIVDELTSLSEKYSGGSMAFRNGGCTIEVYGSENGIEITY